MAKKTKARPRTERREAQRRIDKLARDRRRLFTLEAGGSPERPIEVESAAQIDIRARSLCCARCDLPLAIAHEIGGVAAGRVVRTLQLACRQCGEERVAFFAIGPRPLD